MTMQAQDPGTSNSGGAQPPASPPPMPPTPAKAMPDGNGNGNGVVSGSAPAVSPAQVTPPPAPISTERTPTRKLLADDDALPDDADIFEISKTSLKKRLERANRQQLLKAFGTDNAEEILAWKQRAEEAAKREEEQQLAQMTEAERFKTQYEKASQKAQHWQQQYEQLREQHAMEAQDRQITDLLAKHVKSKCAAFIASELAAHLKSLDESELPQDPAAYVDQWTQAYVKENPEFALAPPAPPAPPTNLQHYNPGATSLDGRNGANGAQHGNGAATAPPRQVQVPFSNGAGTHNRPAPGAQQPYQQKTPVPNQPNSMTDSEWREYKRQNGLDF